MQVLLLGNAAAQSDRNGTENTFTYVLLILASERVGTRFRPLVRPTGALRRGTERQRAT